MEFDKTELLEYFDNTIPLSDFAYGVFAYSLSRGSETLKFQLYAVVRDIEIQLERDESYSSFKLSHVEKISVHEGILSVICTNGEMELRKTSSSITFSHELK